MLGLHRILCQTEAQIANVLASSQKSRHDEEHGNKMVAGKSEQAVSKVKLGRRNLFELPILLLIQATLKIWKTPMQEPLL